MEIQSGFQDGAVPVPSPLYHSRALLGRLAATADAGRLCHAYLFYGERGIGKRTFARHLAAALLCRRSSHAAEDGEEAAGFLLGQPSSLPPLSPEELPCGACSSCRKALSGSHPDIFLYEGKRGANAFHIEEIRTIRQEAYVLPNESEYKIYILPNVEDMTPGAANAFLKVLEEPPPHVVFLLTADNPEMVMETIRSRCILQELYPMPDDELKAALVQMYPDRTAEERDEAAGVAEGILGRAVEVLDSGDYREIAALAERLAGGLAARREYEVLCALNGAAQNRERFLLLLGAVSRRLREALLERVSGQADPAGLAYRLSVTQLEESYALLEQARSAVNGNANLGLLCNWLCMSLMKAVGQRK